jgi:WD40 repeat protein
MAFSPDGQQLATTSDDGTVKVWDVATGPADELAAPQWSFRSLGGLGGVTPDGQRLALYSRRAFRVWEAATGRHLNSVSVSKDYMGPFGFDGRRIAIQEARNVTVQDVATQQVVLRIAAPLPHYANCLTFSPDGRLLARGTPEPVVKIWDVSRENGELTAPLIVLNNGTKGVDEAVFSPDSQRLVTNDLSGVLKIWDVSPARSGTVSAPLLTIKCEKYYTRLRAVSRDGTRLAAVCTPTREGRGPGAAQPASPLVGSPPTVFIWDIATARGEITEPVLRLHGHTGSVDSLCWSPDGTRLASSGIDRTVKLWETLTGQELLSLGDTAFGTGRVAFSRDGQRLTSVGNDGIIRVWETVLPTPELLLQRQATSLVESLYAKPGGKARVLAQIRADATLSEPLRREALSYAERYPTPP